MKGKKSWCFCRAKGMKNCFKLDLAMIMACACDKWGVFAEIWVTSNRQDRNIRVGRVKGMLLEKFHRSWLRSHRWLFSSWSKCDSQQRDEGLNREGLRWCFFFRKKQAQSERLPPTQAALSQVILRVHHQILVWNCDEVANPILPSPENFGWTADENGWMPVMTELRIPPTPDAIGYLPCKVVLMLQGEKLKKTLPM